MTHGNPNDYDIPAFLRVRAAREGLAPATYEELDWCGPIERGEYDGVRYVISRAGNGHLCWYAERPEGNYSWSYTWTDKRLPDWDYVYPGPFNGEPAADGMMWVGVDFEHYGMGRDWADINLVRRHLFGMIDDGKPRPLPPEEEED